MQFHIAIWKPAFAVSLTALLVLGAAACGDDDDDDDGDIGGNGGPTDVAVTLQEFSVNPDTTSVPAGTVNFIVANIGPEDEHEMVVIRTDLDPGDLPTTADGSVDEAGAGIEIVDEIEQFPFGETRTLTLDLAAGNYVLICNVVEEDEAHYTFGMRVGFTVE
jgi:uncharacterized cupredoxin-like copper-binding protein